MVWQPNSQLLFLTRLLWLRQQTWTRCGFGPEAGIVQIDFASASPSKADVHGDAITD
jgi:hypothetical protein